MGRDGRRGRRRRAACCCSNGWTAPRPQTAEIAHKKAKSAAVTHRSGKVWEESVKTRPGVLAFPDAFPITGGCPIVHQGEVIGAVGVSGVQSHEDEQVALAGIAALGL